jgi:uridine phosphorylase
VDFPTDADGRVMHLQVKRGQVANRILSVGDHGRAARLARLFDNDGACSVFGSSRGFKTFLGRFEGVPVTIIATGMVRLSSCFAWVASRWVCRGHP